MPDEEQGRMSLQLLYDEQSRLRGEVEQLRQEQKSKKDDQGGNEDQPKEGEEKKSTTQKARGWIKAHPIYTVLLVLGLIGLLVAGYFIWQYVSSYENTDDAQVDGHTDPISPRINGFVVATYVENTYHVKKGQLLVDLDPRDYEVALAQARANFSQAQANVRAQTPNVPITETSQSTTVINAQLSVASAEASLAAAEETYRSSLSDLAQAEANASNAVAEEQRYRQLVGKQEVSKEIYDQRATDARAQTSLVQSRRATSQAAAKSVTQAQSALEQARKRANEAARNQPRQISVQRETLTQRVAGVQMAKSQVNQALLNLAYCHIYAPEDGIVGDKSVQVGTQVSSGQEMLAVTQTNDLWVTANFKETQVRNIRPGQSVSISVDSLSQTFDGFVEALPGATGATYSLLPPENATGNYVKVVQRLPVRIRFKPGQPHAERLHPGLSVEPKVWIR